jgi:imidazolonepropionase
MNYIFRNISNLVTCKGIPGVPKSGKAQNDIGLLKNGCLVTEKDKITFAGSEKELKKFLKGKNSYKELDCSGKTVMPGFIDSHTHFVFSGSRSDEYEMRISGSTYEEIAKAGGGIAKTVGSVRKSTKEELKSISSKRLEYFVQYGTTTIEGKSGYGLDTNNEIKMLDVINELAKDNEFGLDIFPTFLGAHSIPKGVSKKEYIDLICYDMIPKISEGKKAVFIDVFCEKGYFTADETDRIFSEGVRFGLIPKLHTDQFNSIGGVDVAIKNKALSVDHIEVIKKNDIRKLSNKGIIATALPGVSYFLSIPYTPARELIDNNVPVSLATDFNPGSCMTQNLQMIMSLASIKMKMTAEEIINAVTYNAAYALFNLGKTGSLEPGKQADILIYDFPSYKDLIYNFAVNRLITVFKKGKIIYD